MRTMAMSVALVAGVIGFVAGSSFSGEEQPDPQQMMEEWVKANTPGPMQELISTMAGEWDVTSTLTMGPQEVKDSAKAHHKMVFDGRYLKFKYEGKWQGTPFTGHGFMGHDNVAKKFQSVWIDSMSTGLAWMEGTASEDKKTITLTGTMQTPQGPMKMRHVHRINDDGSHTMEGYMTTPAGEQKHMTLHYTKAAAKTGSGMR